MIGHQHIGVQAAMLALQGFSQPAKIGMAVLVIEEAGLAIVPTLHDVQRHSVDVDPGTSRHGRILAEIEPLFPFLLAPFFFSNRPIDGLDQASGELVGQAV